MSSEEVIRQLGAALRLCAEGLRHYSSASYRGNAPMPDSDAHALRAADAALRLWADSLVNDGNRTGGK